MKRRWTGPDQRSVSLERLGVRATIPDYSPLWGRAEEDSKSLKLLILLCLQSEEGSSDCMHCAQLVFSILGTLGTPCSGNERTHD